nr:hypothetical protein [Tanacetum cinerariifolium]
AILLMRKPALRSLVSRTSKYGESNASALEDLTLKARKTVKEVLIRASGFLHLASSKQLDVVVLVAELGLEFVLGFAPVESTLSQLDLMSAPLGLYLVSPLVHVESDVVHLESALVHLVIQTI